MGLLHSWSVLLIICVCIAWLTTRFIHASNHPLNQVPGPWYARYTHYVLKLNVLCARRMYYIEELHKRYGPFVRLAPNEVAVNDLQAFRQIHSMGSGFLKDPWYQSLSLQPEPGIFSMIDPEQHATRRRVLARAFSVSSLRENWEPAIHERARIAVQQIMENAKRGDVDMLKWWTLMTNDILSYLCFAEKFDMVERGEKAEYVLVLERVALQGGLLSELPLLYKILRYVPLAAVQKGFTATYELEEWGDRAIKNLRRVGKSGSRNIFADFLAEIDKSGGKPGLTERSVRLEAGNFVVAGSDTTAVTITYLIWACLKRPDLQRNLEEEVASVNSFDDASLARLPLLNAVIEETLRVYGAAPGSLPRAVPPGGATLGRYYLPEKTTVSTQAYSMHRKPEIFHNPEEFEPSRFLPPKLLTDDQKTALCAWGAGSRVCLGVHLAKMEMRIATAFFFRECKGARLSETTTDASMYALNFFMTTPTSRRCNVTLAPGNP